jgi:hypothetical protein
MATSGTYDLNLTAANSYLRLPTNTIPKPLLLDLEDRTQKVTMAACRLLDEPGEVALLRIISLLARSRSLTADNAIFSSKHARISAEHCAKYDAHREFIEELLLKVKPIGLNISRVIEAEVSPTTLIHTDTLKQALRKFDESIRTASITLLEAVRDETAMGPMLIARGIKFEFIAHVNSTFRNLMKENPANRFLPAMKAVTLHRFTVSCDLLDIWLQDCIEADISFNIQHSASRIQTFSSIAGASAPSDAVAGYNADKDTAEGLAALDAATAKMDRRIPESPTFVPLQNPPLPTTPAAPGMLKRKPDESATTPRTPHSRPPQHADSRPKDNV